MIKNLLLSIQNRLIEEVPELRYVDEDWGQLQPDQPAANFPCALIDVSQFTYSDIGSLSQVGEGVVTVTLADFHFATTSDSFTRNQRAESYRIFDLVEKVNAVLHGFAAVDFSPLVRLSYRRNPSSRGLRVFTLSYATSYTSTPPQMRRIPRPNPHVDATFS